RQSDAAIVQLRQQIDAETAGQFPIEHDYVGIIVPRKILEHLVAGREGPDFESQLAELGRCRFAIVRIVLDQHQPDASAGQRPYPIRWIGRACRYRGVCTRPERFLFKRRHRWSPQSKWTRYTNVPCSTCEHWKRDRQLYSPPPSLAAGVTKSATLHDGRSTHGPRRPTV